MWIRSGLLVWMPRAVTVLPCSSAHLDDLVEAGESFPTAVLQVTGLVGHGLGAAPTESKGFKIVMDNFPHPLNLRRRLQFPHSYAVC